MNLTEREKEILQSIGAVNRFDDEIVVILSRVPDKILQEVIDICRNRSEISIRIEPEDIKRLDDNKIFLNKQEFNAYYYCQTIAQAHPKILTKHGIKEIIVGAEENPSVEKMGILKYGLIYTKLAMLVKDINRQMPESKKFKIVYTRLANMIDYDVDILDEDSDYAEENLRSSRNLENAVLLNKSVCLGFAETLKQTLSLVGIESKVIHSIVNDDGDQHAYNVVKIDGEWYNVDLTWDYANIRKHIRPKFCLKSDRNFLRCSAIDQQAHTPNEDIDAPKCRRTLEIYPEYSSRHEIYRKFKRRVIKPIKRQMQALLNSNYANMDNSDFRNRLQTANVIQKGDENTNQKNIKKDIEEKSK
jgi:hypothetical protein